MTDSKVLAAVGALEALPIDLVCTNILSLTHISLHDLAAASRTCKALRALCGVSPSNGDGGDGSVASAPRTQAVETGGSNGAGGGGSIDAMQVESTAGARSSGASARQLLETQLLQCVVDASQPRDWRSTILAPSPDLMTVQDSLAVVKYTPGFARRLLLALHRVCTFDPACLGVPPESFLPAVASRAHSSNKDWALGFEVREKGSHAGPEVLSAAMECMRTWCPVAVSWLCLHARVAEDRAVVAHLLELGVLARRTTGPCIFFGNPGARPVPPDVLSWQPGLAELMASCVVGCARTGRNWPEYQDAFATAFLDCWEGDAWRFLGQLAATRCAQLALLGGQGTSAPPGNATASATAAQPATASPAPAPAAQAHTTAVTPGPAPAPGSVLPLQLEASRGAAPIVQHQMLSSHALHAAQAARSFLATLEAAGPQSIGDSLPWSSALRAALAVGDQLTVEQVVTCTEMMAGTTSKEQSWLSIFERHGSAGPLVAAMLRIKSDLIANDKVLVPKARKDSGVAGDGVLRTWSTELLQRACRNNWGTVILTFMQQQQQQQQDQPGGISCALMSKSHLVSLVETCARSGSADALQVLLPLVDMSAKELHRLLDFLVHRSVQDVATWRLLLQQLKCIGAELPGAEKLLNHWVWRRVGDAEAWDIGAAGLVALIHELKLPIPVMHAKLARVQARGQGEVYTAAAIGQWLVADGYPRE